MFTSYHDHLLNQRSSSNEVTVAAACSQSLTRVTFSGSVLPSGVRFLASAVGLDHNPHSDTLSLSLSLSTYHTTPQQPSSPGVVTEQAHMSQPRRTTERVRHRVVNQNRGTHLHAHQLGNRIYTCARTNLPAHVGFGAFVLGGKLRVGRVLAPVVAELHCRGWRSFMQSRYERRFSSLLQRPIK